MNSYFVTSAVVAALTLESEQLQKEPVARRLFEAATEKSDARLLLPQTWLQVLQL